MRRGLFLLPFLLLAVLFWSCSSLPLPNSPNQSLFIIPTDIDSTFREGEFRIVSVQMTLLSLETGKKSLINFFPGASYKAIPVERGRYRLHNAVTTIQRSGGNAQKWNDSHRWLVFDFFIERNVVQMNARGFTVLDNNAGGYRVDRVGTTVDKKTVIKRALQKDDHWLAWQDYKLINFPSD